MPDSITPHTFADLLNGAPSAEILNRLRGDVVRRLHVRAGKVRVDPIVGPAVTISLASPLQLDGEGGIVFGDGLELCGVGDLVRYPTGAVKEIAAAKKRNTKAA